MSHEAGKGSDRRPGEGYAAGHERLWPVPAHRRPCEACGKFNTAWHDCVPAGVWINGRRSDLEGSEK